MMDDLISRQDVIKAVLGSNFSACTVYGRSEEGTATAKELIQAIKDLPSAQPDPLTLRVNRELTKEEYDKLMQDIKDAPIMLLPSAQPEIVRCKDCKYVGTDATCCLVCKREGMGLKPYHVYHDDFCSYAERRTDG